jgi:hypothetical protein
MSVSDKEVMSQGEDESGGKEVERKGNTKLEGEKEDERGFVEGGMCRMCVCVCHHVHVCVCIIPSLSLPSSYSSPPLSSH